MPATLSITILRRWSIRVFYSSGDDRTRGTKPAESNAVIRPFRSRAFRPRADWDVRTVSENGRRPRRSVLLIRSSTKNGPLTGFDVSDISRRRLGGDPTFIRNTKTRRRSNVVDIMYATRRLNGEDTYQGRPRKAKKAFLLTGGFLLPTCDKHASIIPSDQFSHLVNISGHASYLIRYALAKIRYLERKLYRNGRCRNHVLVRTAGMFRFHLDSFVRRSLYYYL